LNREDRSQFLILIEQHAPALLVGVDRDAVTDDHIMALVSEAMTSPAPLTTTGPAGDVDLQALCDAHQLVHHYSERVAVVRDGVTRRVYEPRTRPMTAADILAHRVLDDGRVRVTTADGRRLELGPPSPAALAS
jgi:hypothetical protein